MGRGAELFQSANAARIGWGCGCFLDDQRTASEERTGGEFFLLEEPMPISSEPFSLLFPTSLSPLDPVPDSHPDLEEGPTSHAQEHHPSTDMYDYA